MRRWMVMACAAAAVGIGATARAEFKPAVARVKLDQDKVHAGDRLQATYMFRSNGPAAVDMKVFVHVVRPDGRHIGADFEPDNPDRVRGDCEYFVGEFDVVEFGAAVDRRISAATEVVVRPFYREYHQTLVMKLFLGMEGDPVERLARLNLPEFQLRSVRVACHLAPGMPGLRMAA